MVAENKSQKVEGIIIHQSDRQEGLGGDKIVRGVAYASLPRLQVTNSSLISYCHCNHDKSLLCNQFIVDD